MRAHRRGETGEPAEPRWLLSGSHISIEYRNVHSAAQNMQQGSRAPEPVFRPRVHHCIDTTAQDCIDVFATQALQRILLAYMVD